MLHTPDAVDGSLEPWPTHRDLCDVFIKIGGSILDHEESTAALVPALTALRSQFRLVVFTGGGQAVKRVQANQKKYGSDFYRTWKATALFPEVTAHLLASYSTAFTVVSGAAEIAACCEARNIAVLSPAAAIANSLYFLPDWLATTDSQGLYFAKNCGARRYVIVSNVDGIYDSSSGEVGRGRPIPHLTVEGLERLGAFKPDRRFADYFRRFPVPTTIVNGNHPDRVRAAICGTSTLGTEIGSRTSA